MNVWRVSMTTVLAPSSLVVTSGRRVATTPTAPTMQGPLSAPVRMGTSTEVEMTLIHMIWMKDVKVMITFKFQLSNYDKKKVKFTNMYRKLDIFSNECV